MNNISFYCDIFENFDRNDLAQQLENHVKQYIRYKVKFSQTRPYIDDWYFFGRKPYDRFHDFIKREIENYHTNDIESGIVSSIFLKFHNLNRNGWNSNDRGTISMIDKDILKEVIWTEIDNERYRKQFIHSILLHPVLNEIEGKKEDVREWIIELLKERIDEDLESKVPIKMWLDDTKNLTENLA